MKFYRLAVLALPVLFAACSGSSTPPFDGGTPFDAGGFDAGTSGVDPDRSTVIITVDGGAPIANGVDHCRIVVSVRDPGGVPIRNAQVMLTVSGTANDFSMPMLTDAQGISSSELGTSRAELKTVTAQAGGVTLTQHPTVTFVPGDAVGFHFVVQPSQGRVGVPISPAVVLETIDVGGNRSSSPSLSVSLRLVRSNGGTVTGGTAISSVDGGLVFDNLVINRPQTGYALRAETAASGAADESVLFDVLPGDLSTANSTFTAMPSALQANNTAATTLTLTLKDVGGNLIAGQAVGLSVSGTGNTLGADAGVSDASGVFTTTLKSSVPETKTITATAGNAVLQTTAVFTP